MPRSYEEVIPADHLVRVVNEAIEEIDLQPLLSQYKGGGTSSYHPMMMLKSVGVCLLQKDLHIAEDSGSGAGEHPFHVDQWGEHAGLSDDQ